MAYARPTLPFPLLRLHNAADSDACDDAWSEFVATYSDTLLHTCRAVARDRDAAMDAYAHALEALREDGCRRLRAYVPEPDIKFSSWLVVVTRRLAHDYFRQRYGRSRSEDADRQQEQKARKRLEDLVADEIEPDRLTGKSYDEADAGIRRQQLQFALARALEELDSADHLLLTLRFEDERPVREIARTLGLPSVFHVYRRLGGVLSKLRRALESHGVDTAEP
ncbi:MAG TPA: sigma-70 family RNA polymerase sigma factor [Gemmatimonadaceae bacterium]